MDDVIFVGNGDESSLWDNEDSKWSDSDDFDNSDWIESSEMPPLSAIPDDSFDWSDQNKISTTSMASTIYGQRCSGEGEFIAGKCDCNLGYEGDDCSVANCQSPQAINCGEYR